MFRRKLAYLFGFGAISVMLIGWLMISSYWFPIIDQATPEGVLIFEFETFIFLVSNLSAAIFLRVARKHPVIGLGGFGLFIGFRLVVNLFTYQLYGYTGSLIWEWGEILGTLGGGLLLLVSGLLFLFVSKASSKPHRPLTEA